MKNDLATLDLFEQIRSAKARYCRFLDTKQWAAFAELLMPAPAIRMFDPAGESIATFENREAFVASAEAFLAGAQSIHQVHNDELSHVSESEVRAIWSMEDCIVFPLDASDRPARMRGYGHYHETWLRTPDGWRITRLELRRTLLESTPR
jgi:hypothetical protein